jgi:hypothetical protein
MNRLYQHPNTPDAKSRAFSPIVVFHLLAFSCFCVSPLHALICKVGATIKEDTKMIARGPLMIEHRQIERFFVGD